VDEQISEEPIEVKHEEQSTESNRLVNSCMNENNKFKRVALHGAKLGDIVTVKVKYLVE
jgi:predicted metalloenzyme YecM